MTRLPFPKIFVLLLLAVVTMAWASERPIPRTELRGSETAIVYQGEVRPFGSFARDVLDGFSGNTAYRCGEGEAERCPRKMQAGPTMWNTGAAFPCRLRPLSTSLR